MSAIGIGVIGLGRIAAGVHLPGIQKSARGALAAVCDVNPAVLSAVGDRYGVPAERRFLDYRRLIAAPEVLQGPRRLAAIAGWWDE